MGSNANFPVSGAAKVANIWNTDHAAADEGSFFVATNPVSGTTIAMTTSVVDDALTASATHAPFAPLLYIQNKGSIGDPNTKSIYLRYLRLKQPIAAQAWTSCTSAHFSLRGDQSPRYTSGGTLIVPVNINMGSSNVSAAQINFGAVVTALPSAQGRILGLGLIQGTIPLPGDEWMFTFGTASSMATNILGASAIKHTTIPCGPVIISPGCCFQLDIWGIALAAAPAFEFELGYIERFAGL